MFLKEGYMKKVVLLYALLVLCCLAFAQTALLPKGSGTEKDPYQIANWQNLYWMSENISQNYTYYVQTANIDLNNTFPVIKKWSNRICKGWTPIGYCYEIDNEKKNYNNPFIGSYDGKGYTITGLFIDQLKKKKEEQSEENHNNSYDQRPQISIGLFGGIENSVIKNVKITNASIKENQSIGILAGIIINSEIENCSVSGTIHGNNIIGGLIGIAYGNSKINNCHTDGWINRVYTQEELINETKSNSENNEDTSFSYYIGMVSKIGGIVGLLEDNSTISNSYSNMEIRGDYLIGGITGNNSINITNSFYNYESTLINNISMITVGALNSTMFNQWL